MATSTLFQHPRHEQHPLKPRNFSKDSFPPLCHLCNWKISADGYACEDCNFYAHRVCAEAPPRIDAHPLHTDHPLTLIHCLPPIISNVCDLCDIIHYSVFRCDECDFTLDIRCALSALSDWGGTQGKTPVQIKLPLHPHTLTSFFTRHEFIGDSKCVICKESVEGDGYACLTGSCEFLIHKRCVQDLFGDENDLNLDISCSSSTLLDRGGSEEKTPKWIALPLHHHLLSLFSTGYDFVKAIDCVICKASVEGDGDRYACLHWQCGFLIHKRCVEDLFGDEYDFNMDISCTSPFLLDRGGSEEKTSKWIALPLHRHLLALFSTRYDFVKAIYCVICKASVEGDGDGYACLNWRCEFLIHKRCIQHLFGDEYDLNLDISRASSTLLDQGGSVEKTPKRIALPVHHHLLTLFSTRYNFVEDIYCVICNASDEGDMYACLHWRCEFLIHKRCIHDLYYTDGTKAPQVYHGHPLDTFLGEDTGSSRCAKCESKASSTEFIGCESCQVFYCRDCVQVPEIIQYPHHPDHKLVLLINFPDNDRPRCDSCLVSLEGKLCYGCPSCKLFVDVGCALQILAYCEVGMSAEIKLSWHKHPLLLFHGIGCELGFCYYCEDTSVGPMYVCKEKGCGILLHKRCTEIMSTIIHPHHPDHPLTFRLGGDFERCEACCEKINYFLFSCELCAFYLHDSCAARFPNRKHSLHEHELLNLDKAPFCKCNRCGTSTSSPFFRCVPCNFNLHEECMELPPQVVNNKVHWHPLTLHETYIEDDSGEYYCDQCEKRRDERLGAYVCLQCSARWAYHIECVFPELQKVIVKDNTISIKLLTDEISRGEEEVREAERRLDEMKRELEEKRKKRASLIIIE